MSQIYPTATTALSSGLELFAPPEVDISVEDSRYEQVHPTTSLDRSNIVEFRTISDSSEYVDLSQCFLYTKCKIVLRHGSAELEPPANAVSDPPDKSIVYPVNYFHAALFKNLEVYLNGALVSSNDNLYGYRAYIELLSTYDSNALKNQFATGMYFEDNNDLNEHSTGVSDSTELDINNGARIRFEKTKYSKSFEMLGKIHSDIFAQNKHLINGVELRLKFTRQDARFALMAKDSGQDYNIIIERAILFVKQDKILPSIREAHIKELEKTNLKIPTRRVELKYFTRSPNVNDLSETEICKGQLPRRIILGFVESKAFNGSLHDNPFNFQHFKIRNIQLRVNGQTKPLEMIDMNFEEDQHLLGYLTMLQATGTLFRNTGLSFDPDIYKNGYTLFGFDLSATESDTMGLINQGKISVDVQLAAVHNSAITMIAYLEYDSVIELDRFKNVVET